MALSIAATWGVALVTAAITFTIGAVIVVVIVRHRHRQLMPSPPGLTRGLSTYHRTHLSADASNYAHIPLPRTRLRRSTHLPHGVISEGWTDLPSQDSISLPPMAVISEQRHADPELAQPKRRRSLRATFSPHSFHVPKTRRQKKIDRAIPLNAVRRSPLSAITEFSDPNTRDVSPAIGAVELPTEITPTTTPPRREDIVKASRPTSTQWLLRSDKRRSQDVMEIATESDIDKNSASIRMNSTSHNVAPGRVSLGQRSISMASTISVAPGDPLPPLPTIVASRYPQRNNSRVRSSMASTDTIGSSVLGTVVFSPLHDGTDQTDFTVESPCVAPSPSLLQEYESRPESWSPAAVTMGIPPGTTTSRGLRNGAAGIESFRASIGNPLSRMTSISQVPGTMQNGNINGLADSGLTKIDASTWDLGLSAGGNSFRKSLSPSLPTPVAGYGLSHQHRRPTARHSMYEQHPGISKILWNPAISQGDSGYEVSPVRRPSRPRPASVGSHDPFQCDQKKLPILPNLKFNRSPGSQHRGHKRQNCVRISILPAVDVSRKAEKLPQMVEEDEQPETPTKRNNNIPGLRLIEQDDGNLTYKLAPPVGPASLSPFRNRPVLYPTSRTRATYSRASTRESSGSPRPDSDVFNTSPYDLKTPSIFGSTSPNRHWPLSPTPLNNIKLNETPSAALKKFSEPYDPESPILPSPTLLSATLFPRKYTLHGPRSLPSGAHSGRSSRTTSPSPLQRMGRNANATTTTNTKRSGDDLRRSVMMLRCTNPDLNSTPQDRVSKIYRNIANEYAGSLSNVNSQSPNMVDGTRSLSPVNRSEIDNLAPLPLVTEKRLMCLDTLAVRGGGAARQSHSRLTMGHSISMTSTTGASIWEDASVRGDSSEPEPPVLEDYNDETSKATATVGVDFEAYENFVGQDRKDRVRASKLTSPQGKGLGLMGLGSKDWGTPASLYDIDGFLKE
jgi:hypothetical protein